MTLRTKMFYEARSNKKVIKIGKARFLDGNREHERTLFYNDEDNKNYVIFDGEAQVFRVYPSQFTKDYIVGFIA